MLMFLKNPITGAKVGKNEQFFKTCKIMVFEILAFDFKLTVDCKLLFI